MYYSQVPSTQLCKTNGLFDKHLVPGCELEKVTENLSRLKLQFLKTDKLGALINNKNLRGNYYLKQIGTRACYDFYTVDGFSC